MARHEPTSFLRALGDIARRAGELPLRNASVVTVYTPGLILSEMNTVEGLVRSLGVDVFRQFCQPFASAYEAAEAVFRATRGRVPRAGSDEDWREVARYMGIDPDGIDAQEHCFQGAFMKAFRGFLAEWDAFHAANSGWAARMWGGVHDKTMDFKARVADWRRRFEELGGRPSSPAPRLPEGIPWSKLFIAGGIVAGIVIVPRLVGGS